MKEGGATGIGGKRERIGEEEEEEEEEDEGPKAGSSWQIVAQSRSAQARRCEGGWKRLPGICVAPRRPTRCCGWREDGGTTGIGGKRERRGEEEAEADEGQ